MVSARFSRSRKRSCSPQFSQAGAAIFQLRLADFTRTRTLTLASDEYRVVAAGLDPPAGLEVRQRRDVVHVEPEVHARDAAAVERLRRRHALGADALGQLAGVLLALDLAQFIEHRLDEVVHDLGDRFGVVGGAAEGVQDVIDHPPCDGPRPEDDQRAAEQ